MKERQLKRMDKSSIGRMDEKIAGLCEKINKKENYYTTSSCAGRIILMKSEMEKQRDVFLFRTHEKVELQELKEALLNIEFRGLVEFKQSSCILHVACRCLEDAQELVDKAKLAGWKHSGIMSTRRRIMVELHSTEHIDFPIMLNRKVLVDEGFLDVVIEQANLRLERVWSKINRLNKLL